MPYRSKKQSAFLHAMKPAIAARWDKEYPNQNIKKLPKKVAKNKKPNENRYS